MKKSRRILAIALAFAFMFAFAMSAAAATITVTGPIPGQTYNAYKIFDVKTSAAGTYSYTMAANSKWYDVVSSWAADATTGMTFTALGDHYNVTIDPGVFSPSTFAAYLNTKISTIADLEADATHDTTTGETSITLDVTNPGYYFITSSLGSLCMLQTTTSTAEIEEKNYVPDILKTADKTTASVGESVTFTMTVEAGGSAATDYTVHDTMTSGLTLNQTSFMITTDEGGKPTPVAESNYTLKIAGTASAPTDNCTFEINFLNSYTKDLPKDKVITITYTATVNENAVATGVETNTVYLAYGNSKTEEKMVSVANYGFSLVKTDGDSNVISGAEFEVYTDPARAEDNKMSFILVDGADPYYRPAMDREIGATTTITAGNVKIDGLANGKYYFKETKTPDGYNAVADGVATEIEIKGEDKWATVTDNVYSGTGGLRIINRKGAVIPQTGGVGTTIFYVLGSILLIGAGIILVTRKRMSGTK